MKKKTYKDRVAVVLEMNPEARNNDGTLIATYLYMYHRNLLIDTDGTPSGHMLPLTKIKDLPAFENIRRSRQLLQEEGKHLPTSEAVRKARKINEEAWRNYVSNKDHD